MTSVRIGTRGSWRREHRPLMERLAVNNAWVLNTYASCDIRCNYCITAVQGRSYPKVPRATVANSLRVELDEIGDIAVLGVGSFCDVYPNVEAAECVTRPALEVFAERGLGFTLVTKGPTVVRDIDLFARPDVEIQISLCTVNEDMIRRLEPGAASAKTRLAVLHQLARSGIRVRLQATPWIPGVSDVLALIERLDAEIPVTVTPLRLPHYLARVQRRIGLTQGEVNEAFRREYERVGPRAQLRWSRPPALDGAPPHIDDQIGRRVISDWTAAAAAPDLGPRAEVVTPNRAMKPPR